MSSKCNFLADHALALLAIKVSPYSICPEIAAKIGFSYRKTCRIIDELLSEKYICKVRRGRKVNYKILDLQHKKEPAIEVRKLLNIFKGK
jgi:hypothetical protein